MSQRSPEEKPAPERTDEEMLLFEIQVLGAAQARKSGAKFRQDMERTDPELYRKLSETRPLMFGPNSLRRILLSYPELWPPAKTPNS